MTIADASQTTEGAETSALPKTALEAEELARALDAERAEIARRFREHNRYMPRGADPEWSATAQQLTAEGLRLDKAKAEAWKTARALREREVSRAAWKAWHEVFPEHREICSRIVASLDTLIPAVEAELALHRLLKERAGRSMLPDLRADLDKLHRLRWSAGVVVEARPEPSRNGGGAHD